MDVVRRRVTIVNLTKSKDKNLEKKLKWIGNSLGLLNDRDDDQSCYRVFRELVEAAKDDEGLTSGEIAHRLDLSRGTVVYHLKALMKKGVAVHEGNKYFLRDSSLEGTIRSIRQDIEFAMDRMERASKEIDKMIDLR